MKKYILIFWIFSTSLIYVTAQDRNENMWKNKKCAVALTYDDGLNGHLDKVIPALDSLGFKATFYIPGNSESLSKRLTEWRKIAERGHELGNHTLFHPCTGKRPGREWVNPDYDLNNYSINRMVDEIKLNNTLLKAVDGKDKRTFAYTCGEMSVGDSSFVNLIRGYFVGARGVTSKIENINQVNLMDIGAYFVYEQNGDDLIELVKKAKVNNALIVFLFHGVGEEYSINLDLREHKKLLTYLKENEKEIWIASLVEISEYIKKHR